MWCLSRPAAIMYITTKKMQYTSNRLAVSSAYSAVNYQPDKFLSKFIDLFSLLQTIKKRVFSNFRNSAYFCRTVLQ